MHSTIFPPGVRGGSAQAVKASQARLKPYMDKIRAVTPTGGSYVNEGDVEEPNWQQAFYGASYARLLEIKKLRDPWGLFWAPTTPGSEAWSVTTADGLPTQNGPLCKTQAAGGDDDDGDENDDGGDDDGNVDDDDDDAADDDGVNSDGNDNAGDDD